MIGAIRITWSDGKVGIQWVDQILQAGTNNNINDMKNEDEVDKEEVRKALKREMERQELLRTGIRKSVDWNNVHYEQMYEQPMSDFPFVRRDTRTTPNLDSNRKMDLQSHKMRLESARAKAKAEAEETRRAAAVAKAEVETRRKLYREREREHVRARRVILGEEAIRRAEQASLPDANLDYEYDDKAKKITNVLICIGCLLIVLLLMYIITRYVTGGSKKSQDAVKECLEALKKRMRT